VAGASAARWFGIEVFCLWKTGVVMNPNPAPANPPPADRSGPRNDGDARSRTPGDRRDAEPDPPEEHRPGEVDVEQRTGEDLG
jgi:hypothetical protein